MTGAADRAIDRAWEAPAPRRWAWALVRTLLICLAILAAGLYIGRVGDPGCAEEVAR